MASDNIMASVLKRKRGPLEVEESSKRSRSTKDAHASASQLDLSKVGWEAAFGPIQRYDDTTNEVNGEEAPVTRVPNSPEAVDFQELLERAHAKEQKKTKKKTKWREKAFSHWSTWKTSDPIGGRMIELDPVFTEDEK
jgi:NET1-associated nuclear protein 1 (U3 small nucleolar RNA-associated protein 17)